MNPHHMLVSTSHQFSPPPGMNLTVKSALREWKSARTLLAGTIQTYLAACTTLRVSCTTPLHQSGERAIIEEARATVDSELESLASEEQALYDTRASLGTMRNGSTTLVRINTLPPEILARIFTLSKTHCVHDRDSESNGFAGVCVYWRRVAMDAAELWTHIDFIPNTPDSVPKLLLERSGGTPIHAHIYELRPGEGPDEDMSERAAKQVMAVLRPHSHRVRSFTVESLSRDGFFVLAVLKSWISYDKFSIIKSLLVYRPGSWHFLFLQPHAEQDMIPALHTLHLKNFAFNWDSHIYRGLVDLRLSIAHSISISIPQFANLLSASRALAILKLKGVNVIYTEDSMQLAPIMMEHLKILNLVEVDPENAMVLLSLITLASPLVELGMAFSEHDTSANQLINFFSRSRITTLYCLDYDDPLAFRKHLKCLPHLRILVLHHFDVADLLEDEANPPVPSHSLPFSNPATVILLESMVSLEYLKRFITEYNIRDLRLEKCHVVTASSPGQDMDSVQTSLLGVYPDLQCSVSDTDSTWQLACRTMFDS
ncbi:hypothetical protein FRC08_007104 [Ceratobasidium sp. 394]|nr:hypothetical protein FRC08_007104 [Ceratobasidium sp. 394]